MAENEIIAASDLTMDVQAHTVKCHGKEIKLSRKEWQLLEYFMLNADKVLTKREIQQVVWGEDRDDQAENNSVEVHVSFLRKKLEKGRASKLIETVRGYGYKLNG